jgi:hypothetical protein
MPIRRPSTPYCSASRPPPAPFLTHARVIPIEMVDLGSATPRQHQPLDSEGFPALARRSDYGTAGFHRPACLHVNPAGGVRSCLYAPGAGWQGDLHHRGARGGIEGRAQALVVQLFERGELEDIVVRHLDPWRHLYRQVEHGCGAAALIARLAERLADMQVRVGAPADAAAMEHLHRTLAMEIGPSADAGAVGSA